MCSEVCCLEIQAKTVKTLFWQEAQDGIVLRDCELVRAGAENVGEGK